MLRFLGTGAGEGTPDPFCSCRVCENARKVGGKEIRTRSGFIADDVIVDLGSDFVAQCAHQRISLVDYEHLLISHTHGDHMNHTLIWERFVARKGREKPLNIYLSHEGLRFFEEQYPVVGDKAWLADVNLIPLEIGVARQIGSWKVTPLRGRHGTKFERNSTNYLMEKPGMKLHYALDSGYFFDDTFDALKGAKLDVLIMECTNPILDRSVSGKRDGHMDYFTAMDTLEELYRLEAITASTQVYFTHISPNETTHAEFAAHLAALDTPYRITAAYDGMEI
ncbi:MAG: hypothetical protein IJF67_18195 [Clostridia bacterium]|nr:hypothetical protein [Clostridia bacterium]